MARVVEESLEFTLRKSVLKRQRVSGDGILDP